MADYGHMIMRLRLELSMTDKKSQKNMQHTVQELLAQKIEPFLAQIFSLYVPEEVVINLDQLQVDLGSIHLQSAVPSIVQQIQQKLPPIIKEQVELAIQDPLKRRVIPLMQAKIQAIEHYLMHGHFAWWMPITTQKAIEAIYQELLRASPQALRLLWLQLSQYPQAMQRFAQQFTLPTIQQTIRFLEPAYAQQILAIAADLSMLQDAMPLSANQATIVDHTSIWSSVLSQLVAPAASKFNEPAFIQKSLKKLAKQCHTSYQTFVLMLTQALSKQSNTKTLTSNLANILMQAYESLVVPMLPAPKELTKLPGLIKEFDQHLSQEVRNQQGLANVLQPLLAMRQVPGVRSFLLGYLKSTAHTHQFINQLTDQHIAGLIGVVHAPIQTAFGLVQGLWQKLAKSDTRKNKLIAQLTIRYLTRDLAAVQEPQAYLAYLINKLPLYFPQALANLQALARSHQSALQATYTSELVASLLASLEAKSTQQDLTGPIQTKDNLTPHEFVDWPMDELLAHGLRLVADNLDWLQQPKLISMLKALHLALIPAIATEQTKIDLAKACKAFLGAIIKDKAALPPIDQSLKLWIQQLGDPTTQGQAARTLTKIKVQLQAMLEQVPTKSLTMNKLSFTQEIAVFLVDNFLPPGYTNQAEFIAAIITQVTQKKQVKLALLALLKQPLPRKNLGALLAANNNLDLLGMLSPLSANLCKQYTQILLQADILRQGPVTEKQQILTQVFLEVASQAPDATKQQFIQFTLLTISQQFKIPKQELFRKIKRVAQETVFHTTIIQAFEPLVAQQTSHQAIADPLEIALLPLYDTIQSLLPHLDSMLLLHTTLLPAMQQAIQQRLSPSAMHEAVNDLVASSFPKIAASKHKTVTKVIQKTLQHFVLKQEQDLAKAWTHFLDTGALSSLYASPSSLFHAFIAQPTKQVFQTLIQLLQTVHTRKRLVNSLSTKDLAKLVELLYPAAYPTVITTIEPITALWEQTDFLHTMPQSISHTWWDIALAHLSEAAETDFSAKSWLATSLLSLADVLAIDANNLVFSLLTASQTDPVKPSITHQFTQLLASIQQDWQQKNQKQAQQAYPNQPGLQVLHQLLSTGLSSLQQEQHQALNSLSQALQALVVHQGDAIKELLYNQPDPAVVAKRLAYYLPSTLVEQIIQILDEPAYPTIQAYLQLSVLQDDQASINMDRFAWRKYNEVAILTYLLEKHPSGFNQKAWLQTSLRVLSAHTNNSSQGIIQQLINHHQGSIQHKALLQALQVALTAINQESQLIKLAEPAPAAHTNVPEAVKIYIRNSGLIFLGPFMEPLLAKQALIEAQVFIDNIAASNALHTLQYVATAQLHTPDWRLILNKLLCGMEYDQVISVGYYLREERQLAATVLENLAQEKPDTAKPGMRTQKANKKATKKLPAEIVLLQQNCEELLHTVFRQWPSLKQLEAFEPYKQGFTVQDFKAYFLQREGILQRVVQENGCYWHLTLSLGAYDSPAIQPPWPFKNIRLPWMQEDLVVSWMAE